MTSPAPLSLATAASSAPQGDDVAALFRAAVAAVEALPSAASAYRGLDDSVLLEVNLLAAAATEALGTSRAFVAGEIAHRSAPSLGSEGLAQRGGHRTPEQLIKITNRVTGREAVTVVRVGKLAREADGAGRVDPVTGEVQVPSQPWLAPVADALRARGISVDGADAIRAGLGEPGSGVTVELLREAALRLCRDGAALPPEALFRAARDARDELDVEGVRAREAERHEKRALTFTILPDGMARLIWLMDPETAVTVKDVYDRLTSPKLGGVRFVDAQQQAQSAAILDDQRTVVQLASDGFAQLLRAGSDADTRLLLGSGAPIVRVTTTRTVLATRRGFGHFDGQAPAVSVDTLERLTCTGATMHLSFAPSGQPLDVGRTRRTFTRRQREALAVRDGGCMMPGCDRPPSWCEAHHIKHWVRDHGETNTADGVLLCKHHHLLMHANGWEIRRDPDEHYWLIPPAEHDATQTPIRLTSKSAHLDRVSA